MSTQEKITYSRAVEELEQILAEIESETVDVDVLTEKVKRATHLIKWCKARLRKTETDVQKVLAEIEEKDTETETPEEEVGP